MMKLTRRFAFTAIALGALGMSRPAHADLMITISDGMGHSATFNDGGTGFISIPLTTIGNFQISGSGDAPPMLGDSTPDMISTTQNTVSIVSTAGGGTLTITEVSSGASSDFSPSSAAGSLTAVATASRLDAGGSYTYSSSLTNGGPTFTASDGTVTDTNTHSASTSITPGQTGPFTITSVITYTATASGQHLSDTLTTNVMAAPEPATLAMAFSALPLLGLAAWRRRRDPA